MITCVGAYLCAEMVSLFHCVGGKDDATTLLHSLYHLPHLPTYRERRGRKRETKSNDYIHKHTKHNIVLPITNENSHTHLSPGSLIKSLVGSLRMRMSRSADACHSNQQPSAHSPGEIPTLPLVRIIQVHWTHLCVYETIYNNIAHTTTSIYCIVLSLFLFSLI